MRKTFIKIAVSMAAAICTMFALQPSVALDTNAADISATETVIADIAESANYRLGDVNFDGRISVADASMILRAYTKYQTGEEPLTPLQRKAADVNEDGKIDSRDASLVLSQYSYLATTTEVKIQEEEPVEIQTSSITKTKIYYKPNTHYIHKADCHWCNEDLGTNEELIEIENTDDIECRKCSECNPEIEIVNEYNDPAPVVASDTGLSDYDRRLLAEITCHEYGSDWVSTAEKAKIVAGVMNRVNSSLYPNTIYDVLMQDGQFHGSWDGGHGYWPGCIEPNQGSWDAVDYYFAHQSEFGSYTSWWGNGYQNFFY